MGRGPTTEEVCRGGRARSRDRRAQRPPAAPRRPRADPRVHGRRGRRRVPGRLAGAAGRRRPHAHRRGSDRSRPRGDAARSPAGLRRLHLRPEARRDPVGADQRPDAGRAGGGVHGRGRTPARRTLRTSTAERSPWSPPSGSWSTSRAAALLARADRRSLNIAGAFWHIVTDLVAFVATLVAGLVIYLTGWMQADAVATAVRGRPDGCSRRTACCATAPGSSSRPRREGSSPGAVEAGIRGGRRRHRCARAPRLGGHLGLPGAVGARAGRLRRGLPRAAAGDRGGARASGSASTHTTLQVDHRDDVLPTSALGQRLHPEPGGHPHH